MTKNLHYLTSATGLFAIFVTQNNQGGAMHYTLKDHQGSLTATVCGNTVERLSYDAWGRRRNPDGFGYDNVAHTFGRGYTLHEHYDDFGLVNMNGRMYDPQMSGFLSVDAYVQSPENAQGFNRYAYCLNNPLRYTDPSGWRLCGPMPGNPFHDNWSRSFVEPVYEPRDLGIEQLTDYEAIWMQGEFLSSGRGGGGTRGGFYDQHGNYLGSDGKCNGKVYIIRSEIPEVMKKKEQIMNYFEKGVSSLTLSEIYDCFVEIISSHFMRNMMYTIVSQDDGTGGTVESNNREYGGYINEIGMVIELPKGEPKTPGKDSNITFDFPYGTKYATFHSHPSGNGESQKNDDCIRTPFFQQSPTLKDLEIAGNHICYVFGRRDGCVYVYNRAGVQAIITTSNFISHSKFCKP